MKKVILIILLVIVLSAVFYIVFLRNKNNKEAGIKENTAAINNNAINNNIDNSKEKEEINTSLDSFEIQGMKIEILKQGEGREAKNGDTVSAHYTGTLENGTKFDSSVDRGQPFSFVLGAGKVIKGWDLGILGMKVGEKRKLTIPYNLAYGESGMGNVILPKATLIFEVELVGIN